MKIVTYIPRPGDYGSAGVKVLQQALNEKMPSLKVKVDGDFGPATKTAVSKFQKSVGLPGSGVPGPKTITALGIKVGMASEAPPVPATSLSLSWDSKPERIEWSNYLISRLYGIYESHIIKIKDMARFRPDWAGLTKDQQIFVIAELIVQMAKYESGWNPKSASVDVGKKEKRDTWSIGLLQISVVDQSWAKPRDKAKYTYEELLTAIPNLDLSLAILTRQIEKDGRLVLPNKSNLRYWAVMLDGNKYSKVSAIESFIKKLNVSLAPKQEAKKPTGKITRKTIADLIVANIQKDIDAGLRETHGKNRSPRIDSFNKRAKSYLGAPYCASGGWCAIDDACKELGLNNPVPPTASSQAFRRASFVPAKYMRPEGSLGKKGDVGVLQQVENPDQGHYVTVSEDQVKHPLFKAVEYNTDGSGSRDGDGAYAMVRSTVDRSKSNSGKIFVCFTDVPQWILDANKSKV